MKELFNKLLEKIKEYNKIIIFGHIRPDGDCLGCQFGLYHILKETYKDKEIHVVGEESNYINFLGKPSVLPDDYFTNFLAISVDLPDYERISDKRYDKASYKVKIDHHQTINNFADLEIVSSTKPACTVLIYEFYKEFENELKMNHDAAFSLYTGLITDTGRFYYAANEEIFLMASDLMKYDIDNKKLQLSLSKESYNTLKFKGYVINNFKVTSDGFAYCVIKQKIIKKYKLSNEEAANMVNVFSSLSNVLVWALVIEYEDEIRLRIRSKNIRIDTLANKYNGGGHMLASGAKLNSFKDLKQFIIDANNHIIENKTNE